MKILLVNPPSRNPIQSILPPEVEQARGLFPPLGILYLAAGVRDLPGVQIEVVDAHAEDSSAQDIARRVVDGGHDLVGISTLTFTLIDALNTASAIKTARPEVPVIAGGPHAHLFPEQTLALGPFDAILRGEGEKSFRELVEGWPDTKDNPPPGVWWKEGSKGEPEITPHISDLDALAFPARDLTNISLYHSVLSGLRPITTMMSSRGCPYKCVFCDRPHLGKSFRARSAKNVVDEMEECQRAGIKEIVFYDDTFSVDRDRVREIAQLILERELELAWDIRARVSDLGLDDYKLLKRAGLARVHFGVESGDPGILKSLKKGITIEQARQAFAMAGKAGLETLAYFMVGLPGETKETLSRTMDLSRELLPDYVHFSILIPFPGTPIYQTALERGIIGSDVWAEFAKEPRPDFTPPVWEEGLKASQIQEALAAMYKKFYSQPGVIFKRLRRVRSLSGFVQGARMGYRILSMRGKEK